MIGQRISALAVAALAVACQPRVDGMPETPSAPADASPSPAVDAGDGWRLVWSDEFDGPAGQLPDPASWTAEIGGHGWGNDELQYYTNRGVNASLDGDGHLAIVARREQLGGRAYTSARLVTRDRFEHAYGRFEARIQLPSGQGLWPAFWLLGANFEGAGWPDCGEIDILEQKGHDPYVIHGSLHGPGYSGGDAITRTHLMDSDSSSGFHVYAVEWSAERIIWTVDGELFHTATPASVSERGRWVYDHPFFIILNVAVGGHFVPPPTSATPFPQTMRVDYVRVYESVP